jgi:hypothetical protein
MSDQGYEPDFEHDGNIHFVLPPEQEAGFYANTFAIWHTGYDFTIDFAASQLPERSNPDDPESPVVVPCRVVARVRIPAGTVFALLRTINERMSVYEAEWGPIREPTPREQEESDEES